MFNKDFYPTPDDVIHEMMYGVNFEGKIIYEPSAGSGNIVKWLLANGAKEVIASEKHADLRQILNSKCKVIAEDFLTVGSADISHIDLIVMNPPFSADDKHIIHAFEIAPPGCEIVALCNYETYRNSYTDSRYRMRAIIKDNGQITDIGNVFTTAERTTDVRIGLIKLKKPGAAHDEFDGFIMDEEPELSGSEGIMPYNLIRDLVNRYVAAVRLYDEQLAVGIRMKELTDNFYSSNLSFSCSVDGAPTLRSEFKKDLQKSAWNWVFAKMNMNKYTTKGLKEDINKFVERQTAIPFTMKNIYKMIEIIVGTHGGRMEKAIIEVFEKLTTHYHENRYNVEGWKTNSHYLMNEKFIMPSITSAGWSGEMSYKIMYNWSGELIEDLCKALCYLTATDYNTIPTLEETIKNRYMLKYKNGKYLIGYDNRSSSIDTITARCETLVKQGKDIIIVDNGAEWGKWFDWGFFEVKGYKKGTMHFKFKDRKIWMLLNQEVARIKGYPLPEGMKKAAA